MPKIWTSEELITAAKQSHPEKTERMTDNAIIARIREIRPDIEISGPELTTPQKTNILAEQVAALSPEKALPAIAQNPMKAMQDIGKVGGIAGLTAAQIAGHQFPLGGLVSAPITAATQYPISRLMGEKHPEALTQALTAGASDLALTGVMSGIPAILRGVGKFGTRFGLGVPKRQAQRAIGKLKRGDPFFKGEFNETGRFDTLRKKAFQGLRKLRTDAGEEVGKYIQRLNKSNVKINTRPIINKIDNAMSQLVIEGQTGNLGELGLKNINTLKDKLGTVKTLGGLQKIKETAQSMAKTSYEESVIGRKPGTIEKEMVKKIGRWAREMVETKAPKAFKDDLIKANRNFEKIADIYDRVNPKIKSITSFKNTFQRWFPRGAGGVSGLSRVERDAFRKLNRMVGTKDKFLSDTLDTISRSPFEAERPIANLGALRLLTALPFHPRLVKGYLKSVGTAQIPSAIQVPIKQAATRLVTQGE